VPWRCAICGTKNDDDDSRFCKNCGNPRPGERRSVGGGPAPGRGPRIAEEITYPGNRITVGGKSRLVFGPFASLLNSTTAKKVKKRATSLILLMVFAALVTIGTPAIPILGIPHLTMPWLAAALVMWAGYSIMPSESESMEGTEIRKCKLCGTTNKPNTTPGTQYTPPQTICSVCGGTYEPIIEHFVGSKNWGPLYAKSFVKLLAIIFLTIQAYQLSILIALAVVFISYFSMPVSYSTDRPYKAAEAWFRMLLGFFLAILITVFLTPKPGDLFTFGSIGMVALTFFIAFLMVLTQMSLKKTIITIILGIAIIVAMNTAFAMMVPSMAMFYLTIAFFATTPAREKAEGTWNHAAATIDPTQGIPVITKGGLDQAAAAMSGYVEKMQDQWNAVGTGIFLAFALLAGIPILGSWLSGASVELRWVVGLVWAMSLFIGTVSGKEGRPYIGIVVLTFAFIAFSFAYSTTVGTAVFGDSWGVIQSTGGAFFGPISKQMDQGSCDAYATWLCISEGPVQCSQEKLKCDRTNAEAVGAQTAIEFESFKTDPPQYNVHEINTIYFELANNGDYDAKDVKLYIAPDNGEVQILNEKEGTAKTTGTMKIDSCIGGNLSDTNTCIWTGNMPKGGRGAVIFTADWNNHNSVDNLEGLFPDIKMSASYDYIVRSTYSADVRSSDEMKRILLSGESIAGTVAQFSGGPVMASIWTPKYIQSGQPTLVTASLTNNKDGVAMKPVYCIYLPKEAQVLQVTKNKKDAKVDDTGAGCTPHTGAKAIKCSWNQINDVSSVDDNAQPLNSKTCSFEISLDIGSAAQKQLPITGEAAYTYVVPYEKKDVMFAYVNEENPGQNMHTVTSTTTTVVGT